MALACDVPDEILLDIFEYLRNDDFPALRKAMSCCRDWYRVASGVLYSHLKLESKLREESRASRFARQLQHDKVDLVRSINVQFSQVHLMGLNIESSEAYDRVHELRSAVLRLRMLQTFSISLEDATGQGFALPTLAICGMIRSLPQTVTRLNLDCVLYNFMVSQPHLCAAVSSLLPRLKYLRLRLNQFCGQIFDSIRSSKNTVSSALEYAVIRLDTPQTKQGSRTHRCHSEVLLSAGKLVDHVQILQDAGRLPRLRKFVIIERLDAVPSVRNDSWSVFKVCELRPASVTTTVFPYCARGGSSSLYMIRDMVGDWFGTFQQVSSAVEGALAGTECDARSRKFRQRSSDDGNSRTGWTLDHAHLASRNSVTEKFGVSFRLWKHEERTEKRLLQVHTAAGYDDTASLTEVVPPGWSWVTGGPWNWALEPVEP